MPIKVGINGFGRIGRLGAHGSSAIDKDINWSPSTTSTDANTSRYLSNTTPC